MLGFGGWPLASNQDVLLNTKQEVLGMLTPLDGSRSIPDERNPEPVELDASEEAACPSID